MSDRCLYSLGDSLEIVGYRDTSRNTRGVVIAIRDIIWGEPLREARKFMTRSQFLVTVQSVEKDGTSSFRQFYDRYLTTV